MKSKEFKKEAIVGVREDGSVRAIFCIDSPEDVKEAVKTALRWENEGRTVKRCSQEHARAAVGRQWLEPGQEPPV